MLIGDSDFGTTDPLTGAEPPEGNGHQAEFSHDNEFVLAADEDFAPYRAGSFEITSGPNAGEYEASEVPGGTSVTFLPDLTLNGPVVYGGYGCPTSTAPRRPGSKPIPPRSSVALPPLAAGEEAIVVLQRGPTGDPREPGGGVLPRREGRERHRSRLRRRADRQPASGHRRRELRLGRLPVQPADRDAVHDAHRLPPAVRRDAVG